MCLFPKKKEINSTDKQYYRACLLQWLLSFIILAFWCFLMSSLFVLFNIFFSSASLLCMCGTVSGTRVFPVRGDWIIFLNEFFALILFSSRCLCLL